ncbi:proline permease PrnB [Cordyceps fumosorosea ARSEF 2679]|uniref:Proline permease PrnB n=1 Tax=Cordyceps fumosorosea (strain ARSEF 2679) TaxID=1081104 RepID=A0A167XGV7_CORFA|nr:proline permease PrnB [Cordyceps fumosorosea ARSEF 2679]OAA64968.1 proline permease PrnB [Cordyceps fumosorosea ARSEF 2679]
MSDQDRPRHLSDDGVTAASSDHATTKATLKDRHLYMIAMGGCIGTAFLVGSGRTLSRGGPALTLAGFATTCVVVWVFATLLFELAAALPLRGAGADAYATRLLSRSWGFALGWNYWYAYAVLVPFEMTAAALVVGYWAPPVSDAVFVTILLVVVVGLNYLPVAHSGEAEFAFSSLKLSMLVGTMILSVVVAAGGGPNGDAVGFRYWHDPGPANPWIVPGGGGKFLSPMFTPLLFFYLPHLKLSFLGEMVAICGGETKDARKSIPRASKALIVRLVCFSVLPIFFVTLICPSNAPELTSGGAGAGSSPFVIGIKMAGIRVLDHMVNAVILCSAWSAGNVYLYLASRSIYSLALAGSAPKMFAQRNRWGVPYWAVTSCAVVALLAYLNVSSSAGQVFTWLVNMINMAAFFSWILMSFAHLRFRAAMDAQGLDRSTLPYVSRYGKPGAWLCIIYFTVIGSLNGFNVFFPGHWSASDFLTAYIGTVLFVVLYVGHKMTVGRGDAWVIPVEQVDLSSLHQETAIEATVSPDTETSRSKSSLCDKLACKRG